MNLEHVRPDTFANVNPIDFDPYSVIGERRKIGLYKCGLERVARFRGNHNLPEIIDDNDLLHTNRVIDKVRSLVPEMPHFFTLISPVDALVMAAAHDGGEIGKGDFPVYTGGDRGEEKIVHKAAEKQYVLDRLMPQIDDDMTRLWVTNLYLCYEERNPNDVLAQFLSLLDKWDSGEMIFRHLILPSQNPRDRFVEANHTLKSYLEPGRNILTQLPVESEARTEIKGFLHRIVDDCSAGGNFDDIVNKAHDEIESAPHLDMRAN